MLGSGESIGPVSGQRGRQTSCSDQLLHEDATVKWATLLNTTMKTQHLLAQSLSEVLKSAFR